MQHKDFSWLLLLWELGHWLKDEIMTFTHALATNNYGPVKFIVSASAANGTHTTITSALAVASSGDTVWVRDGTYTENFTLPAGILLTAASSAGDTPTVTVIGKITMTAAGTSTISNIKLQTNSDFCLVVSGSNSVTLYLDNCFIYALNNSGISITNSGGAYVQLYQCKGDTGTTGIAFLAVSNTSNILIYYSRITNLGVSTTASTISGTGGIVAFFSEIDFPLSISATGFNAINGTMFCDSMNATAITSSGTATVNLQGQFNSGSASAISVGSGSTVRVTKGFIVSQNTNAITGAGTIILQDVCFPLADGSSKSGINTTTQVLDRFIGGTQQTSLPAGDYTVLNSDTFVGATTSAARAITMPASPKAGETHIIKDITGTGNTHNITISGNGSNIDGAATNVINTNYGFRTVTYTGTIWAINSSG